MNNKLKKTSIYKFCKDNKVVNKYDSINVIASGLIAMPNEGEKLKDFKKRILNHLAARLYRIKRIKASSAYRLVKVVKHNPVILTKGVVEALPNWKSILTSLNKFYSETVSVMWYDEELYKTRPTYKTKEGVYNRIVEIIKSIDKFEIEITDEIDKW